MAELKTKPDIRFTGFTDAWEQRKLGDEAEILAGGDVDKSKLSEKGKYPVIANALTGDGIIGYYDDEYRIKVPAVTVTGRGDVGHARARTINFTPVVRLLSVKSKHDSYFLENAINTHRVIIESTGVPQLTVPQLSSYEIWFSSLEEETRIGMFFKKLNDLITLHQREYDKTVNIKKAMLEKMFPKDGADKPEIRFAGFTDAWEQRKVSDLVTPIVREVPKPTEPYDKISVRSHAKGTFHQRIENPDIVAMDKLFVVKENDLIVNITFAWEHAIAVATKNDDGLLVSHRFPTYIMNNSDVGFMKYVVSQEGFRRKMELISPGGAGRNRVLDKKGFLDIEVIAPNKISEQNRIGNVFLELDRLITLHQRELEKLQNMKKAMLEKMFV